MAQRVILDGLWCGQGMANMVRVFDRTDVDPNTTPADWLCLFDFGSGGLSASRKVLGITPPVKFVMDQLELQQSAGRTPRIELMLISHQDRDHWALLGELDAQIVERGMTVEVGKMMLSGSNWRDSSERAVGKFAARTADPDNDVTWYDGEYSSYYDPSNSAPVLSLGDLELWMLVTNVATNDSKEDIERNCSSAVVLLRLKLRFNQYTSFILPGDATWETFARLQEIMGAWKNNPLPAVYAASVPHHGALRTMNRNSSVDDPDLSDLVWFTGYTRPTSIYASAGIYNTHSHPYRVVLEVMGRYTSARQFQPRPIVVFNGGSGEFELIQNMRDNIYTTVLNLTSPALTANWIFDISELNQSTGIQLFEAGVPGILSAPVLSEMELAAQRAMANEDEEFKMDTSDTEMVFTHSPILYALPEDFFEQAPTAGRGMAWASLPSADTAAPIRARHLPQPTAGATPNAARAAPPKRIRVVSRAS